jgi:hypothetical protein
MIYLAITTSILIAIVLFFLEYIIEGNISYFPAIVALLLIIPLRQMVILTRDIDGISQKMENIKNCLQIHSKLPKDSGISLKSSGKKS